MTKFTTSLRHLPALALFVAMAVAWTWPLATSLSTAIPGESGDNLAFLWNTWWMREALASNTTGFFHTDHLFAPFGIDLVLHTHTALPAWIAGTVLGRFSTVAAQNLVILGSLALNAFAAYLLAWDRTGTRGPSLVAGLVFGGGAYITAHLLGHYNLICAWGLPLFVLCLLRAVERRSPVASAAAGACVAVTAYCDYYYVVYEAVLGIGIGLSGLGAVEMAWVRQKTVPWARAVLGTLLLLDVGLIVAIVASGGFVSSVAGIRIVAMRPTNPLAVGWLLLVLLLLTRVRPRLRLSLRSRDLLVDRLRALAPAVAVAVVGMIPLLMSAWALLLRGDYTAPAHSWRSGPAGVDLATLVLGNPSHGWFGSWVRTLYDRLAIDRVEGTGWMGVLPTAMFAWAALRAREDRETRRWLVVAAVFFVWSLGPWLHVGGIDTGLLLPQNVLTLIPIVSNARIPGRAMVVVSLAAAMVVARVLDRSTVGRRSPVIVVSLILVAVDQWPSPFPLTRLETPALYAQLREMPDGAVCELPMGIRDGLGLSGVFDDRVLNYQMTHGHPIVGGFAARVPLSIKAGYRELPVLRSLLGLSGGRQADPRDGALSREDVAVALQRATVAFVVLDRASATPALTEYVERFLPLRLVVKEGARELYAVTAPGDLDRGP